MDQGQACNQEEDRKAPVEQVQQLGTREEGRKAPVEQVQTGTREEGLAYIPAEVPLDVVEAPHSDLVPVSRSPGEES